MIFKKKITQNKKLLKNIEIYEQKEKAEQQEPKVCSKKQSKGGEDTKKTRMYHI